MPSLIAAAQAGDDDALAELYRLHQPVVHRYIAHRIASPQTAEDLTQEVFIRAYRKLGTFQWTGRPFGAWLMTIARNIVLDELRRPVYQREVLADDVGVWEPPAVPSVEAQVLADLDAEPVRAALRSLLPAWREVLVLEHWAGLSNPQIGQRTGRTTGGVRTLKYRASTALRHQLTAA
jgi:RNA polymerase sigma-70 factor (ECF subfamily)